MVRRRSVWTALVLSFLVCILPSTAAPPQQHRGLETFSQTGVMLPGANSVLLYFAIPPCAAEEAWLLKSMQVGPELETGATAQDLPLLPAWGVSAIIQQRGWGTRPVTMIAPGPAHVSTAIEGGQPFSGDVTVILLGSAVATGRFQFNVHVSGQCGVPTVLGE
jgi:hypothetical protein